MRKRRARAGDACQRWRRFMSALTATTAKIMTIKAIVKRRPYCGPRIGRPHFGQAQASDETWLLQSGQGTSATALSAPS